MRHFSCFKKQMVKSELIALMTGKQPQLPRQDVELAVNCIIEHLAATVAKGERIEIRGFGGFSMVKRDERIGRNPKTGETVRIPNKYSLHFKPGLDLRERVNASQLVFKTIKDI